MDVLCVTGKGPGQGGSTPARFGMCGFLILCRKDSKTWIQMILRVHLLSGMKKGIRIEEATSQQEWAKVGLLRLKKARLTHQNEGTVGLGIILWSALPLSWICPVLIGVSVTYFFDFIHSWVCLALIGSLLSISLTGWCKLLPLWFVRREVNHLFLSVFG